MKMKKTFAAITAATLALSLPMTTLAKSWEDVNDYDKLSEAFGDTETEVHITLSGDISQTGQDQLIAGEGQTYTIDGKEYTLTDVYIGGGGDVTINADVQGADREALSTSDSVSVTVNGDITSEYDAVNANDQSTVEVNGDITSKNGDGVYANDDTKVTVNGDIHGGAGADGVDAAGNAQVTVNGDVYGGNGSAPDEEGNLDNGNMNTPGGYSDGGAGIEADENAQVTVNGDVYGGDAYGTFGYGGAGIEAYDSAAVNITGNAQGGDLIANPDVPSEDMYGYAGDAVYMSNTADVTVGGDAIGGNANGQDAIAGAGVYVELTLKVEEVTNPDTGIDEEQEMIPGQVTVGGTAIGGDTTAKGGYDSEAVYYQYWGDDNSDMCLPDELIEQISSDTDTEYVRACVSNFAAGSVYDAGLKYLSHEERLERVADYEAQVTELAREYGVDVDNMTDFEEVVNAVPGDKLQEFTSAALNRHNDIVMNMVVNSFAVPTLTVNKMQVSGDADLVGAHLDELVGHILESDVNYSVQVGDIQNGSVAVDKNAAKPGDTIVVTPAADDGYELKAVCVNGVEIEPVDGIYSFEMLENAGITVTAEFEKIPEPEAEKETVDRVPVEKDNNSTSETPKTGDTSRILGMGMVLISSAMIILFLGMNVIRKRRS